MVFQIRIFVVALTHVTDLVYARIPQMVLRARTVLIVTPAHNAKFVSISIYRLEVLFYSSYALKIGDEIYYLVKIDFSAKSFEESLLIDQLFKFWFKILFTSL